MALSWDDLASRALGRQFPLDRPGSVAAMVKAIGPMQTQTARSAFIGLAARFPGATHEAITAAYDAGEIVRGSTIRGTVHTAAPPHFRALGAATRIGQRRMWIQQLGLPDELVETLWEATEEYAADWRTPDELRQHLADWVAEHHPSSTPLLENSQAGRFLPFAHGGLIRRPASGTAWEGQGRPLYRTFEPTGDASLADVVRLHVRSHGPASAHDVAWWSGLRRKVVDEVLDSLDLVRAEGPGGLTYVDHADAPEPRELPGVRFLPEFDALLCGYDSKARDRFITPGHHAQLWSRTNGLILPPLLVDGRITGYWRAMGSARARPLEVRWFAGTRRPLKSELAEPVAALEAGLGITITQVSVNRA